MCDLDESPIAVLVAVSSESECLADPVDRASRSWLSLASVSVAGDSWRGFTMTSEEPPPRQLGQAPSPRRQPDDQQKCERRRLTSPTKPEPTAADLHRIRDATLAMATAFWYKGVSVALTRRNAMPSNPI
jgi:hypothetical protein